MPATENSHFKKQQCVFLINHRLFNIFCSVKYVLPVTPNDIKLIFEFKDANLSWKLKWFKTF